MHTKTNIDILLQNPIIFAGTDTVLYYRKILVKRAISFYSYNKVYMHSVHIYGIVHVWCTCVLRV